MASGSESQMVSQQKEYNCLNIAARKCPKITNLYVLPNLLLMSQHKE